jgi:hypothetical protein
MKRSLTCLFSVLTLTLLLGVASSAQVSSTGSLSGTVADPSGAVVANASVTLKNTATNQEFTTQTNDGGNFNIPSVATGLYTATIVAPGFKKAEVSGIKIDVGKPSDIKIELEVGAPTETVLVSGAGGELLQTQSATVGTTITGRQITELPYASRNALDLLLFLPGTSTAGRPRQSTVNGLPKSQLNITLDGLNIQDNVLKGSDGFFTLVQPKTDAVQEVTVSTSNPGAESNSEGAVQIKFTTRSGSNEFHGSLYETHRDKSLNSNFFWNNELLAPKPHFGKAPSPSDRAPRTNALLNQPGGRLGGPIWIPKLFNGKDKAFFFVNYEEYRLPEAQLRTRTVLSPSAISGIFTSGTTATNLFTLAAASDCDAATPGLQPCPSTPDPTINALMAQIRGAQGSFTPTSDPNIQQLSFTNQGGQKRKFPTARLDFELNKKNHVETIYNYQMFRSKVDFLNNADPFAPGFPNFGSQDSNRYSFVIAWRSQLGTNLVNEARFGIQNGIVLFFPQNNAGQFVNQGGFDQNISVAASGISNVTTINSPQRRNTPTTQYSDNMSYVWGKHTFNFGGNLTTVRTFLQGSSNGAVPTIGYGQDSSDIIDTTMFNSTNFPDANARAQADTLYRVLTGRLTSISHFATLNEQGTGYALDDFRIERYRQREIGFYAQDSWRFRSNLTVNFGLRLETVCAPISQNKGLTQNTFAGLFGTSGSDLSALFKPGATGGSVTQFTALPPGQHLYNTRHNLAPTFGFAYQPNFKHGFMRKLTGEAGQTVIRGGWSMAFAREGLNLTSSIVGANFGGTRDLSQFAGSDFARGSLFRSLPPGPVVPGAPTFPLTPGFTDSASANAFLPSLKTPYVISFSGSIQRELSKDTVLEIGYTGNRGHQLLRQFNLNEVNILENGFANEFKLAQANLAANVSHGCGTTFRYFGATPTNPACIGTSPLPLFLAFFSGLPASSAGNAANYTSSRFGSSTFTSRLTPSNFQAIGIAGILNQRVQVSANGNPYMANAATAGLPANFFVVNPVMFNNFGAGNGSFLVNNDGKTWYDALTVELRRRLSKGILASFNYTFARALGNEYVSSSIAFLQPATIRNTFLNKDFSPFDIRQSLKGSYIIELPFGRGKHFFSNSNGVVNTLLGDWTLNGTLRVSTGVPLNMGNVQVVGMSRKDFEDAIKIRKTPDHKVFWLPQDIVDNTRRAFNVCIPNTTGCDANGHGTAALSGGIAGGSPTGKYIAPAGLNCVQSFTGQCGFTTLIVHGPRFTRADMGIEKKFKFSETKNLEFRFEFLNAFNNIDFRLGSYNSDTVTIGANAATNRDIPTYSLSGFGQLLGSNTAYRDVSTTNDPGGRVGQIVIRFNF